MRYKVTVLGAGLAGCEAALWLAGKGVEVTLYEQKPTHFSPAHKSEGFAELICSNSLKAERLDSASGLLKEEMRRMGSQLLPAAEEARVAAGGALAVDRDAFSAAVTRRVEQCPNITVKRERMKKMKADPHYNALQVKYAYAVTCHKAQGGQWQNVFLDQGYMSDEYLTPDYFRWLYTAFTRASKTLYLVNYPEEQIE